jgi:hypothetical protein
MLEAGRAELEGAARRVVLYRLDPPLRLEKVERHERIGVSGLARLERRLGGERQAAGPAVGDIPGLGLV